ncbi:MAG: hypothetical protein U9R32_06775 [Bacteroidota bacterium]|nr:hypothetical protein [Bacteroidota bacterium]
MIFSFAVNSTEKLCKKDLVLVCSAKNDEGEATFYYVIDLFNKMEGDNEWEVVKGSFDAYNFSSSKDKLKLYLWNKGGINYSIDDVKITVSETK